MALGRLELEMCFKHDCCLDLLVAIELDDQCQDVRVCPSLGSAVVKYNQSPCNIVWK